MKPGMKHIALAVLMVCMLAWAARASDSIEVNGNFISVHADGMARGELLKAVQNVTGIRFSFDETVGEGGVFLDFKGLPLPDGIKRIIHPWSSAMIYDDMGNLRRVIIIQQWKGSETREGRHSVIRERQFGSPHRDAFATGNPDSPPISEALPSGKKGFQPAGPLKKTNTVDEPSGRHDAVVDGPPAGRAQREDGPPALPEGANPDVPPPHESKAPAADGPPLDRKYEVDGPPDVKGKETDGPPAK
jgi:hypothetical protein